MDQTHFGQVALIGIGLIGSSLARVIAREKLADRIAISSRSAETLERARELGLGDSYHQSAAQAARDSDLVILCTPVGVVGKIAEEIASSLKPGAILSDVGSVKGSVVNQIQPHIPEGVHLVPAHPVAGTEYSGPDAGFAALFENRWCILTPVPSTSQAAVDTTRRFWEACGSNVEVMTPEHHDLVLAITSHIPHLIAYNIVGTAADLESVTQSEVIKFSAGGFRDFTRIAASDPTMWRDVFLHNKDAVLETLGRFSEDLSALQRSIRWGDGQALFDLFTRTRAIRRSIIEIGQESSTPNFGRDSDNTKP
ncbi:MAG: prephenate/arogenate dehydrogenase family protein [Rhizobiaceae bacterium]